MLGSRGWYSGVVVQVGGVWRWTVHGGRRGGSRIGQASDQVFNENDNLCSHLRMFNNIMLYSVKHERKESSFKFLWIMNLADKKVIISMIQSFI